jgi:hypothetical protein
MQAQALATGADYDWLEEFTSGQSGAPATLDARVIGFAAVLDNLTSIADRQARPLEVVLVWALFGLAWTFLMGGFLDRLARDRRTGAHGFFAACGLMFPRFLRLAVPMFLVYALLFGSFHPWLFEELLAALTRNETAERSVFAVLLALYAVFAAVLAAANLLFDYARVRIVVEDRRSALGAVAAAVRFLSRHGRTAVGLYAADVLLLLLVMAAYALVAPGAGGTGWTMWLGFALGQAYIVARVWVKLVFWASATALFQSRLAHAGYVARPLPAWPDAPVVERM